MNSEAQDKIAKNEQVNDNEATMRSLSSAAPKIKSKVASVSDLATSLTAAKSSVASDEYVVNKEDKLNSLNSMALAARKYIPQLKDQANSNKAQYQKLSMSNDEINGTDASLGAALANPNSNSQSNSLNRAFQTKLF